MVFTLFQFHLKDIISARDLAIAALTAISGPMPLGSPIASAMMVFFADMPACRTGARRRQTLT